jgi:hypothetical protein
MNILKKHATTLSIGLVVTLMSQTAVANHTSEFHDMNSGTGPGLSSTLTTPNSALGVSYGLTGNYLGAFGAESVSWGGLDNTGSLVNISFDLIVRGVWLSGDTFDVTFSSSGSGGSSPVDTLVAFTPSGSVPLPAGVSQLYSGTTDTFERAYHVTATAHALYSGYSPGSGWTLTFTGTPSSTFAAPHNGTWGIDNLDIRWGASAVPEPASVMLLVSALPLIAGAAYRRRRLTLS